MNNDAATIAKHEATAKAIFLTLMGIDPAKVAVVSTERRLPRKELAAAARKVFAGLKLKGISVTAPNYSMAQGVDVRVPRMLTTGMVEDSTEYVLIRNDNNATVRKIEAILLAAFPNTDNRSDSQSDYFDFCWSVGTQGI